MRDYAKVTNEEHDQRIKGEAVGSCQQSERGVPPGEILSNRQYEWACPCPTQTPWRLVLCWYNVSTSCTCLQCISRYYILSLAVRTNETELMNWLVAKQVSPAFASWGISSLPAFDCGLCLHQRAFSILWSFHWSTLWSLQTQEKYIGCSDLV